MTGRISAPIHVRIARRALIAALSLLVRSALRRNRPIVVAVTGSVGKTTTKELTAAVLSTRYRVRATWRNANDEVGARVTVLAARRGRTASARARALLDGLVLVALRRPFPELLVVELAAGRPGELERLTRDIRPDVAVVTNVRPVHLEHYPDAGLEGIVHEKSWVVRRLKPGGVAVLNADDERSRGLASLASGRVLLYGSAPKADVRLARADLAAGDASAVVQIRGEAQPLHVQTRMLGEQQLSSVLAALAVGLALDVPPEEAAAAIAECEPLPGHLRVASGRKGLVVLDDSSNASPQAVVDSLDVLARFPSPRWAVLGDMAELGAETEAGHRSVGAAVPGRADVLVCVGHRAEMIADSAVEHGMPSERVVRVATASDAARAVAASPDAATVLVKGSAVVGLATVVEALAPR